MKNKNFESKSSSGFRIIGNIILFILGIYLIYVIIYAFIVPFAGTMSKEYYIANNPLTKEITIYFEGNRIGIFNNYNKSKLTSVSEDDKAIDFQVYDYIDKQLTQIHCIKGGSCQFEYSKVKDK